MTYDIRKKILKIWKTEYLYEERPKYNILSIAGMKVILTSNSKVLKDYINVKRKGLIKNVNDPFEMDIFDKIKDELHMNIHPELYYVMWSE